MRGNLTRLLANHCSVRALTSALPPASRGLDRKFWTTTALALVFSSLGRIGTGAGAGPVRATWCLRQRYLHVGRQPLSQRHRLHIPTTPLIITSRFSRVSEVIIPAGRRRRRRQPR